MEDLLKIREIIVVEGRADIAAVKRAVDAEIIATDGFGFSHDAMTRIRKAHARRGIIVLTDPDNAGARIRRKISAALDTPCKHAHLPRRLCTRAHDGNVGVENAPPELIRQALREAHAERRDHDATFSIEDMIRGGLHGGPGAAGRRRDLGERLGIGYANARQCLARLNSYGVTRHEFEAALVALQPAQEEAQGD
jgi:ribonuclease M5